MLHLLAKNWWALLIRGLVAIAFGILTFMWPGLTLIYLVYLFGFYALFDGIFNLVASFRTPGEHWAFILEGILGIVAAFLTFFWPGITAIVLLYVIAFWAILTGIFEIVGGVRLRHVIRNEFWLILMGILSILFGAFILIAPGAGALAIVIWIGAYALVFGVMMVILSVRLRGHRHDVPGATAVPV